jgi:hypothetical protein
MIPTFLLWKLEWPTKSQLQAKSFSTNFPTLLNYYFFPSGGEAVLHKLSMTHHNFGSSRTTPSRLGGFTSKSNECHKDCFIKLKSAHKDCVSLKPPLRFSQKSHFPHKEGLGRVLYGSRMSVFMGGTSSHQRREGETFILVLQKLIAEN